MSILLIQNAVSSHVLRIELTAGTILRLLYNLFQHGVLHLHALVFRIQSNVLSSQLKSIRFETIFHLCVLLLQGVVPYLHLLDHSLQLFNPFVISIMLRLFADVDESLKKVLRLNLHNIIMKEDLTQQNLKIMTELNNIVTSHTNINLYSDDLLESTMIMMRISAIIWETGAKDRMKFELKLK